MARNRKRSPGAELQTEPRSMGNANADERHRLLYRGASGQMAVMSEFLYRLINVAVPEVDVGDDVFVARENDEFVIRVQVKYSQGDEQKSGSYVAQFDLPWVQFDRVNDTPVLVYVFAVRYRGRWTDFCVACRAVLRQLQADHGIGTVVTNAAGEAINLKLRLVFTADDVQAKGGYSIQHFRNAFDPWPPLLP